MQSSGLPENITKSIMDYYSENPDNLKRADKLFNKHRHPEHSIVFTKVQCENEYCINLSPVAVVILSVLYQNMNTDNLIKASQNELIKYTSLGNKSTVSRALKELLDKGYIAIKIEATGKAGAVYMVNPDIATIGNNSNKNLNEIFWMLTGSKFEYKNNNGKSYKDVTMSTPHKTWVELNSNKHYSRGYDKQKERNGSEKFIRFNKFNPPEIKTSSAATPDVSKDDNPANEDLPI